MMAKAERINSRLALEDGSRSMAGSYNGPSGTRQWPNDTPPKNGKTDTPIPKQSEKSLWSNRYYVRMLPALAVWIAIGQMPTVFTTAWGAKYFGSDKDGTQTFNYDKYNRLYSFFGSGSGLVSFLSQGLLGRISDSVGRKPLLYMVVLLTLLCYAPLIWFPNPWILFIMTVPCGLIASNASYPPFMLAYFSDVLPESQRTLAYSIGYGFGAIGGMLGMGAAMAVSIFFNDQMQFIVMTVISAALFAYALFIVPESLTVDKRKPFTCGEINPFKPFYRCCFHPIVFWAAIIEFVICFPELCAGDIVIVYALDTLNVSNETKADGISTFMWVSFLVGMFLGSFLLLPLLQRRKWNDLWILSLGIVTFAISFLLFAIFGYMTDETNMYIVLIAAGVLMAFGFISFPAINSIISRHLIKTEQGIGFGVVFAVRSVSWAAAPVASSRLYYFFEQFGISQLLFACVALAMFMALIMVIFPLRMYINIAKKNQKPFTFSSSQLEHNERMI